MRQKPLKPFLGFSKAFFDREVVLHFCRKLDLSEKVVDRTLSLWGKIKDKNLRETDKTILASLIYISSILCKETRSQREIGNILGISDVSIRGCYHKILSITEGEK